MATNQSAAYDLSLFEKKKAIITPLHSKKLTKAEKRRVRVQKLLNATAMVAVAGVVLVFISMMITKQIQLTEVTSEINRQEAIYTETISENKRLESELAANTSAQSVETYAESAGLRPMESGQIDYITVTLPQEQPRVETGWWAAVVGAIQAWLN